MEFQHCIYSPKIILMVEYLNKHLCVCAFVGAGHCLLRAPFPQAGPTTTLSAKRWICCWSMTVPVWRSTGPLTVIDSASCSRVLHTGTEHHRTLGMAGLTAGTAQQPAVDVPRLDCNFGGSFCSKISNCMLALISLA